ncbi:MAG: sugar transferase [uncultured bacterium]|nr:MAG: sugar transferase [uncultured bacterium]
MFKRAIFHLFIRYAPAIDALINLSIFYFGSIVIKTHFTGQAGVESNLIVLILSVVYSLLWMFNSFGEGYYRFKRVRQLVDEFFIMLPVTIKTYLELIAIYTLLGGIFWNDYSFFHRRFFIYSIVVQSVVFLYYQYTLIRIYALLHNKGYNIKHIMIAGVNENSVKLSDVITQNPLWGYNVVGYLDRGPESAVKYGIEKLYCGGFENIEKMYFDKKFDRIICCLPTKDYDETQKIIRICEKNNIDIHIVPDIFYFITSNSSINNMEGIPVISLYDPPLAGMGGFMKRAMDLILSFLGLIVLSPLLLLLAALVKWGSKGPIFYSQERVGLDNRPFMMYKFRSMYTDSEFQSGPKWADKNDPRCTRIGAILRKTSLDELPQLFNVLKGDMSLVGPRPERPFFVQKFKEEIKDYMKRHRVKAGITGWAQVNGLRGSSTSLEQRIQYDLYYIENWSLWFDVKILFKTVMVVWNDKNAY